MATQVYRRRKLINSRSPISELGDDDLVEILIRLPGSRSAFRCKPVCKRWNSLISAPYFSRRFVSHRQTLSSAAADEFESPALILSQARQLISRFLPFPRELRSKFSVLDVNKDLLLLGFWGPENDQELRRTHLVCNPFTKQWAALPLAPKMSARFNRSIVKLVSEPFNSPGEGPLFPSRFRVVRMHDPARLGFSRVEVYIFCSRSGRWKKFFLPLDLDLRYYSVRVVSANDKLYWLNHQHRVVKWDPFCQDHGGKLPILIEDSQLHGSANGPWVSEGALHVVCRGDRAWGALSVWRLEGGRGAGGGWRKQYEVLSLKELRCIGEMKDGSKTENLDLRRIPYVIGLHSAKSEIVFIMQCRLSTSQFLIFSCDFKKKELDFLAYLDEESRAYTRIDELVCQPRLSLWPNSIPGHEKFQNNVPWKS